jgi:hypothetical protein
MAPLAVFYQACPVCGRSIRMPVQCFGRQITCVHCGGEFRADEGQQSAGLPGCTTGSPAQPADHRSVAERAAVQ